MRIQILISIQMSQPPQPQVTPIPIPMKMIRPPQPQVTPIPIPISIPIPIPTSHLNSKFHFSETFQF